MKIHVRRIPNPSLLYVIILILLIEVGTQHNVIKMYSLDMKKHNDPQPFIREFD